MATLEKIRSKQTLLFTIVIIALFLFIISIASADSIRRLVGFGPGTDIAQVGNQKIPYEDYRQLIEQANRQNQQQKVDHDELAQQAIQQLIYQTMLNDQIEKLGINVTDAEITQAMTGPNLHPASARFIQMVSQAMGFPMANGQNVFNAIKAPGKYNLSADQLNYLAQAYFGAPTMEHAWANVENDVDKYIKQQAFNSLLSGLFTANKLDAMAAFNDNSTTKYISYVSVPLAQVPDDQVEVNDADIKAKYEQMKSNYKLNEETRAVDYIMVPIAPTKQDYDAAEVEVDRLVEGLASQPGLEGLTTSSSFMQDPFNIPVADVKKEQKLIGLPDSALVKEKVYKYRRMGNTFRVAKVIDVANQVDSVNLSQIIVRDAAMADSIINLLNGGKTFAELVAENADNAADSIWGSLVGAPEKLAASIEGAQIGRPFVYNDSTETTVPVVMCVNKRVAPKPYANIVLFTREVDPSPTTISDIKTKLNGFLASNNRAELFSANADSLYTLRHATVTPSTPKLGYAASSRGSMGVNDSRRAIKWAMDAKKGQVSPVFEDNRDYYVVVALTDIYGDQYIPYSTAQVHDELNSLVKADKKADKLINEYQGKASDIAGYAQVMGSEVRTDSTVVFGSPRFASFGGKEYALQAQAAAAQKGSLVGPVKGANEVVVFVVDDAVEAGRPFDEQQDKMTFMNIFGMRDPYGLLVGDRKIKNYSLKFENNDR